MAENHASTRLPITRKNRIDLSSPKLSGYPIYLPRKFHSCVAEFGSVVLLVIHENRDPKPSLERPKKAVKR